MTTITKLSVLLPPLKWAGKKTFLAPRLKELFSPGNLWIEPFCGGLGASLGVLPERAILADINCHLINFYQWIKDCGIWDLPESLNESSAYYARRDWFNDLTEWISSGLATSRMKADSAQLFYYLNKAGYNGLCRFNNQGKFNIPFGRRKTINFQTDFTEYQDVFDGWDFRCCDFDRLTQDINSRSFVYIDPPYSGTFNTYSSGGFDWNDQIRLAKWAAHLPCPVVASNSNDSHIVDLYQSLGFEITFVQARRSISCKPDGRGKVSEMLAFKI